MATLYEGRHGEVVDYSTLAVHHKPYLRTTLKRLLNCIDDIKCRDPSPLVCVDFGTGDGSLAVKIFEAVRDHLLSKKDDREITLMLEDQETNDFNKTIQRFRNSPLWVDDKISILFNAKNMYKQCFSNASLDVVLSSFATMIFNKSPLQLKGELFPLNAILTDNERKVFRDKLNDQWCDFMKTRSVELKSGGYLVNYVICVTGDKKPYGPWPGGWELLNEVWRGFCADKNIGSLNRVTYPLYFGLPEDYQAPFQDGVYSGFRLISIEIVEGDVYKYPKQSGNETEDAERLEEFLANVILYFKAWMYNALKRNLPTNLSDAEKDDLVEAYYARLQDRLRKGDLEEGCFHFAEIILKRI